MDRKSVRKLLHRAGRRGFGRGPAALTLAAMVGGAVVVGCASSSSSGGGATGTITWATESTGSQLAAEKALIAGFEKANPKIKVDVSAVAFDNYTTKLTTELRAGKGPDIGRVNHPDVQTFVGAKFLVPLDENIKSEKQDLSGFIPGLLDVGKVKGKAVHAPT